MNTADIVGDYIKRVTEMKPTKSCLWCRSMTIVIEQ